MIPNPFAAFVPSKNFGSPSSVVAHQQQDPGSSEQEHPKIDVLAWFARATLDVIGEAGACARAWFFFPLRLLIHVCFL